MSSVKSIILGTAGHIDHGKSSLVKALTGTDPDRLKEEKDRGITIDLGFASLSYPDGLTVGIVDVPGHERLIKNMLAGAGGIDIVMMVIAADEGIMPQSREHLAICELLKIKKGIIALTKSDLVDDEWLKLVSDEIKNFVKGSFLEDADIIPVSSKSGMNLEMLKEKIRQSAMQIEPKLTGGLFRLPIDRVFTLKGFGTVVTGTAVSGSISVDDTVEILPAGISTKVRGLQSHGQSVNTAYAGRRTGINLQGVDRESLKRGDVVASQGRFIPTSAVDANLLLLKDAPELKNRSLVHFYCGTAETIARVIIYEKDSVAAGESCYCQFRLHEPIVAVAGDRYIIRRFSPLATIGGGEALDPYPYKRKKSCGIEDLVVFSEGSLKDKIEMKVKKSGLSGISLHAIEGWIQGNLSDISAAVESLLKGGKLIAEHGNKQGALFHAEVFYDFKNTVSNALKSFHKNNPLKIGMSKEELRGTIKIEPEIFNSLIPLIPEIVHEQDCLKMSGFSASSADSGLKGKIIEALNKAGLQPPLKHELAQTLSKPEKEIADILKLLAKEDSVVRINDSMYITKEEYDKMISFLRDFFAKKPEMTVAEFRDMLATTRKYALPFLEYLDSNKITLRVGDIRKFMLK
jgi:selenocysteine-specific elongation factor